jgi:hypothetical protein
VGFSSGCPRTWTYLRIDADFFQNFGCRVQVRRSADVRRCFIKSHDRTLGMDGRSSRGFRGPLHGDDEARFDIDARVNSKQTRSRRERAKPRGEALDSEPPGSTVYTSSGSSDVQSDCAVLLFRLLSDDYLDRRDVPHLRPFADYLCIDVDPLDRKGPVS